MTVATQSNRNDYNGDTAALVYPYTFKITESSDMTVYVNGALVTSGYTVSGAGTASGGNVTFTSAVGCVPVALVRSVPYTQATEYVENSEFPASSHEDALDKLTMLVQQAKELATRALRFAAGSIHAAAGVVLPDLVANKYLRVNAGCTGFDLVSLAADCTLGVPISPADGGFGTNLGTGTAYASLTPATGSRNIARVSDCTRGFWIDTGTWTRFLPFVDLKRDFHCAGDGSTDDTAAIQAALDSRRPIWAPCGTYVVTSTLRYSDGAPVSAAGPAGAGLVLMGEGMKRTIFDNRVANCGLFHLNGSCVAANFMFGGKMADFSIRTTTSPATSHGIIIEGAYYFTIDNVHITGLSGDGIRLHSDNGDDDAPSNLEIRQCDIRQNSGWGIRWVTPSAVTNIGLVKIAGTQVIGNTLGGIFFTGIEGIIEGGSISWNRGCGVWVRHQEAGPVALTVRGTEFDSNCQSHVSIESGQNFRFEDNLWTLQRLSSSPAPDAFGPVLPVTIGDGTHTVEHAVFKNNRVRSTPTNPTDATTAYTVRANAMYVEIADTTWSSYSGANAIKYSDAGTNTIIREEGKFAKMQHRLYAINLETCGTYTPNLTCATIHRINAIGTGAITVANPSTADRAEGRVLEFILINSGGGTIRPTFGSAYLPTSEDDTARPASTKRKTARYIYDSEAGAFVRSGDWSNDI